MKHPSRLRFAGVISTGAALALVATGCTSNQPSSETDGVTITVAMFGSPPPQAALDEFTADTGITVNWTTNDWDSLQTKIAAAATSNTFFADVTDVDWSRVGQEGKLGWFLPMEDYIDTDALTEDMPQIPSFTYEGHVVGIPFDASIMVTTVNTEMFANAGITTMPTTMDEYTDDLRQIKAEGIVENPLNIPFAAAEGLSTYWFQATEAFGGTILNGAGEPQFTTPDSAGYRAAQWMIDALNEGLVPEGNINVADGQGQQTLMAQGLVASTFGDYSGNVGSLYDVASASTVVGNVEYLPTPGVEGIASNVSNPDGIGIPNTAKYPEAAGIFIEWLTSTENQANFAGAKGEEFVLKGYALPSRISGLQALADADVLPGGEQLIELLQNSKPVFPEGAPVWYPEFSNAVYTSLHSAATGSISVEDALAAIAAVADAKSKQ